MQQRNNTATISSSSNKDLLFITDVNLRKKIENAIITMAGLYLLEEDKKIPSALYIEVRRVIILYAASIIEALLLFVYKKRQFSYPKLEYVHISPLPDVFQPNTSEMFVLAKQIRKERLERELMLDVLLKYFVKEDIIKPELEMKIVHAKNIRNTLHLSKSRRNISCSRKYVDEANDTIVETITVLRNYLKNN